MTDCNLHRQLAPVTGSVLIYVARIIGTCSSFMSHSVTGEILLLYEIRYFVISVILRDDYSVVKLYCNW